MDITGFKSFIQRWTTIALLNYQQARTGSMIPDLAYVYDNTTLRENPVSFEQTFFSVGVFRFADEITSTGALQQVPWVVPLEGYGAAVPFNVIDLDRPNTLARIEQVAPTIGPKLEQKKLAMMLDVFRKNATCYDGRDFFDGSHKHPANLGTFSNLLAPNWVNPAVPTVAEAISFLDEAALALAYNMQVDYEAEEVSEERLLVVQVNSQAMASVFKRINTRATFDANTETNPYFRKLRIYLDRRPAAGTENYVRVLDPIPNGPRPIVLVVDKEPSGLEVFDKHSFGNQSIAYGMSSIFGVKPLHPQAAVEGRPT